MNNTTLIKVSKEKVITLAEEAVKHFEGLRQGRRSDALTRLTTERRFFGILAPYSMEQAIKMVDTMDFDSYDTVWYRRWFELWLNDIFRLKELKRIAEAEATQDIYVGTEDWDLLNKGL